MPQAGHPIDLNLPTKLRDRSYRQKFFLAEASAQIAKQLIDLRKRRDRNQKEVAELIGTQQPAISRVERADYQNWSFNTLRSIADALDARIRVIIQPSEDVLKEYEEDQDSAAPSAEIAFEPAQQSNVFVHKLYGALQLAHANPLNVLSIFAIPLSSTPSLDRELAAKDAEIARLKDENNRLRSALMTNIPANRVQPQPGQTIFGNPIAQGFPQKDLLAWN